MELSQLGHGKLKLSSGNLRLIGFQRLPKFRAVQISCKVVQLSPEFLLDRCSLRGILPPSQRLLPNRNLIAPAR